jgi:hypothetical protein
VVKDVAQEQVSHEFIQLLHMNHQFTIAEYALPIVFFSLKNEAALIRHDVVPVQVGGFIFGPAPG